jgi:hypothetical protein|tara:strand:- start:8997 stop:9173 length:177 start_codon:yes stop_codon:yes gene_type:complete
MNNQNIKNQLEMFGLKVRDAEFFKQSEETLKDFIIKDKPKKGKVSDEEKDKKDDSEVK